MLTRRAFVALVGALPFVKGLGHVAVSAQQKAHAPAVPPSRPAQKFPIPCTLYSDTGEVVGHAKVAGGRNVVKPCLLADGSYAEAVFKFTGYDGDSANGCTHISARYVSGPKYWLPRRPA